MVSWRGEYLADLTERDGTREVNWDLVHAYTQLADRLAALEAEKGLATFSEMNKNRGNANPGTIQNEPMQLKSDLAEALRAKGQLQSRLKSVEEDLTRLKHKYNAETKILKELAAERTVLVTKVKDRDEELRGKAKLLEDVQNESLSLTLELNMAEKRSKKLEEENKQLIHRWMTRMGQVADDMNNTSNF